MVVVVGYSACCIDAIVRLHIGLAVAPCAIVLYACALLCRYSGTSKIKDAALGQGLKEAMSTF